MQKELLVYKFSNDNTDGSAELRDILGGKGANLAQMCKLGLPVPPGFTIPTVCCNQYVENGTIGSALRQQVAENIAFIEQKIGKLFGSETDPLLLSVRSGSKFSMPGMMDTILNLGLNDKTVEALSIKTNNRKFALDSYRRLIQMFANVVLEIDHHIFEQALTSAKFNARVISDHELSEKHLEKLISQYKSLVYQHSGIGFPQDPEVQLWMSIEAVFKSWNNARAKIYRAINNISHNLGTAVNVQAMVFGNKGEDSATGVLFSRNPSTGEDEIYGEYLINAQGEDVVAGLRTPLPLNVKNNSMEKQFPLLYHELVEYAKKLELFFNDMQDIEFTIENGNLWLLQTRNGKRSVQAQIKIAHDMAIEGKISKAQAILRIDAEATAQLLHKQLDYSIPHIVLTKGLPASPGAAAGRVVFDPNKAAIIAQTHPIILVRNETSPEDIEGMYAAQGILTARGGMTSHAAVVARGIGKPCITGAQNLIINERQNALYFEGNNEVIYEGEVITINGSTGEIFKGLLKTTEPSLSSEFLTILQWAQQHKNMGVHANAETATDLQTALKFGAEGVGLCRTEHMFFNDKRITSIRKMILASNDNERIAALAELEPYQTDDFYELFEILAGKAITIRLLDPPLHEFLPHTMEEINKLAKTLNIADVDIQKRCSLLQEANPMLGHRGARLAITYPEIYAMQARAIFAAAFKILEAGKELALEIMIPLIFSEKEVELLTKIIKDIYHEVSVKHPRHKLQYTVGAMIELPRAALIAHKIADKLDFFSFGTNDLTQTTFGISRDDAAKFLESYKNEGILTADPFVTIDQEGVGTLLRIAIENSKNVNPKLKFGICGEHGGDTASIKFVYKLGMDYVSCSPYRIPTAIIAVAQSTIEESKRVEGVSDKQ